MALWRQLLSVHRKKIEVRREGTKKIQDVVSAIISNDAFTFHRGAQLHRLLLLIQHAVLLNLIGTETRNMILRPVF